MIQFSAIIELQSQKQTLKIDASHGDWRGPNLTFYDISTPVGNLAEKIIFETRLRRDEAKWLHRLLEKYLEWTDDQPDV
jgi:hypothetical protein